MLGLVAAAVGTNVAMKIIMSSGGSLTGVGYLALRSVKRLTSNAAHLAFSPFWGKMLRTTT